MKCLWSVLFFLFSTVVCAKDSVPSSCKPVAIKGETVTISAKKPLLVLVHNLSSSDLWMTHPVSNAGASSGWTSQLQAGKWSALALDKDGFTLNCIESKPGHEQQVPCQGVISVCRFAKAIMPSKKIGSYWAGENMSLSNLKEHLGGQGFELPGSSQ